jgi:hypothetical protein
LLVSRIIRHGLRTKRVHVVFDAPTSLRGGVGVNVKFAELTNNRNRMRTIIVARIITAVCFEAGECSRSQRAVVTNLPQGLDE